MIALILWMITGGTSTVAQSREDFLAANIDPTVSPADDFFQYAHGGWFRRNPIPDGAARWGISNVLSEEVDTRLRRISEEAAAKTSRRGSDEQLVGDLWATGMDQATLNKQGLGPLQPDFDRIGRVRTVTDVVDIVASFHKRSSGSLRVLFVGLVEENERDSTQWIYNLQQGGIIMNAASYSGTDPRTIRVRAAYRAYLLKTFDRLHGNPGKAKSSADAVFSLEAQLATAFEPRLGYQKAGLGELSRLAPAFDWDRYLRGIGVDPRDAVNLRSVRFFQTLDSLFRTIPLDTWKDYLRLWLIRMNVGFLDDAALLDYRAYDNVVLGFEGDPRPRWRRVVAQERNFSLGQPLARLYLREYFPAAANQRYAGVAESMRAAFRERIERLDWMANSTRQAALRKLERLTITIGFGDLSTDFRNMSLRRDGYALNIMRANEWFHAQDVGKLKRPVDRTAGDPRPSWTDAAYDDAANTVTLSPGAVKVPTGWRVEELEDAFLYGATALGHEIAHGFDSEGRYYDPDGNKVDWWTPADSAAFLERSQHLVDQYNEFMPVDGLHVNGRSSLRENMADFTGLRIALDAFKKTEQFRKGERIGGFTPLQRFFLAFAYGGMSQSTPEALAAQLQLQGSYAPARERVNGVLMNIPEFYEAFGVQPGDRMFRAESARARIW